MLVGLKDKQLPVPHAYNSLLSRFDNRRLNVSVTE